MKSRSLALLLLTILLAGVLPMGVVAQLNCSGGIWGCITPWSSGSIPFVASNGTLTQDNTNLIWNASGHYLQLGGTGSVANPYQFYARDRYNSGGWPAFLYSWQSTGFGGIGPDTQNADNVVRIGYASGVNQSWAADTTTILSVANGYRVAGVPTFSGTAPTISSGFGSSPSIVSGTATSFRVNVGTGGVATSGVIGLPTATNGWNCDAADLVNGATMVTVPTTSNTTSVTLANYSRTTGLATAWAASDILGVRCTGF